MNKEKLEKIFNYHCFIELEDEILFSDLELYNKNTNRIKRYGSIDEIINDKPLLEKLKAITFEFVYSGGRGANFKSKDMGGGFTSAGGRKNKGKLKFPAEFNVGTARMSQEKTIKRFIEKYKNAKVEYGLSVDEQGFVHRHVQGGATSVSIQASGKGHMVIHNHPVSGGNFSKGDLLSTAADKNARGIVATGSKTYTLTKTQKFDAKRFAKAVNNAMWPKEYSYDKGADWWLRKNAKKYGYRYSARK